MSSKENNRKKGRQIKPNGRHPTSLQSKMTLCSIHVTQKYYFLYKECYKNDNLNLDSCMTKIKTSLS